MSQGSSTFLKESAFLSIRVVTMDYYLSPPLSDIDATFSSFRSHVISRVPVLRVFGPTPAGQKTCLHLHGILPYLYVPVPEPCPPGFAHRLANSLERALNLSAGQSESAQQVFSVQEVSGTPFYGYHPRQHRFFKIYLYNPSATRRAADLLQNGGVMGVRLQPHEAHVPYTLQFMMDYNLQGMNFIHLAGVKFRRRMVSDEEMMERLKSSRSGDFTNLSLLSQDKWLDVRELPPSAERTFNVDELPEALLMQDSAERLATTELEVDGVASDILNSNEAADEDDITGMNPGLQALWEDERERRRMKDMEEEELEAPQSPPRPEAALRLTESEVFWKERLLERLEKARREHPEMFEEDAAGSSDLDATCNFFVKEEEEEEKGEKDLVYPAETPEMSQLPSATEVCSHIAALSTTIFEDTVPPSPERNESIRERRRRRRKTSSRTNEETKDKREDILDNSIVDKAVVLSQSQRRTSEVEEVAAVAFSSSVRVAAEDEDEGDVDLFGDDNEEEDKKLVELLEELGREEGERLKESQQGSTEALSQLSARSREREAETAAETAEMSQVWSDSDGEEDSAGEEEKEEAKETVPVVTKSASGAENVWGSDDDDDFWNNLIAKNT